jgi:hypothetical protein
MAERKREFPFSTTEGELIHVKYVENQGAENHHK